ncbi:PREDICTED: uncharacterized protein LOC107173891, partial [Diuraphis noxia]|uniref:uncharacterized protein LOC107173891 n=1 Tax=Diuraphis noxia TaxID=143948 RepID=UPI0007639B38
RDINAIRQTHGESVRSLQHIQCGAAVVQHKYVYHTAHACFVQVHRARTGTRIQYHYGRLFGAGRAVRLAVHIRVLQVLPRKSTRRRAGRVPIRQRHQARAPARGVRRIRRVRKRPTAVRLTQHTRRT